MILALISGFIVCVVRKSFFVRFVLNEHSKNGRFVSDSAKIWICGLYSCRQFTMKETEIIELLRGKIERIYPTANKRLLEIFDELKFNKWAMNYRIVDRFIRCNMGADNLQEFDIEDGFLNLEEVTCPLHGICKDENIICRPKENSVFSQAEKKVVLLYAKGYSVDEIASKLDKNRSTVNNQIWQVTRRLGLSRRRQLIQIAVDYKMV